MLGINSEPPPMAALHAIFEKNIDMCECNMQKYVADNDDFFEFLTKHTYTEEGKGGWWHHQQLEPVLGGALSSCVAVSSW